MKKQMISEYVVLVDEQDNQIGLVAKQDVHHQYTPLHRAFSLYIFNQQGEFLLQQRKKNKVTWGGFWSNSCCGHPGKKETYQEAAKRRARQEFGIDVKNIEKIADYRYRFEHNNVVENEICPIFVGRVLSKEVDPDPMEVEDMKWVNWSWLFGDMKRYKEQYSPWLQEQALILVKSPHFTEWLKTQHLILT